MIGKIIDNCVTCTNLYIYDLLSPGLSYLKFMLCYVMLPYLVC